MSKSSSAPSLPPQLRAICVTSYGGKAHSLDLDLDARQAFTTWSQQVFFLFYVYILAAVGSAVIGLLVPADAKLIIAQFPPRNLELAEEAAVLFAPVAQVRQAIVYE